MVKWIVDDDVKSHKKKGKGERMWDQGLTLALIASLDLIFGKYGERRQRLQREKKRGGYSRIIGGRS